MKVLRDLPGIASIETMLRSRDAFTGKNDQACMEAIDRVSISLFSIADYHTWYDNITFDEPVTEVEWEKSFANVLRPYDETRPFWAAIGWDISDGKGNELACAHYFARQIIVTAAGDELLVDITFTPNGSGTLGVTHGDLEMSEEEMAERLQREAEEFMKGREG